MSNPKASKCEHRPSQSRGVVIYPYDNPSIVSGGDTVIIRNGDDIVMPPDDDTIIVECKVCCDGTVCCKKIQTMYTTLHTGIMKVRSTLCHKRNDILFCLFSSGFLIIIYFLICLLGIENHCASVKECGILFDKKYLCTTHLCDTTPYSLDAMQDIASSREYRKVTPDVSWFDVSLDLTVNDHHAVICKQAKMGDPIYLAAKKAALECIRSKINTSIMSLKYIIASEVVLSYSDEVCAIDNKERDFCRTNESFCYCPNSSALLARRRRRECIPSTYTQAIGRSKAMDDTIEMNIKNTYSVCHSSPSLPPFLPDYTPTTTPEFSNLSSFPSSKPTSMPSNFPSFAPSATPSITPSLSPSTHPSQTPSTVPSLSPSTHPSQTPSITPSLSPSTHPSQTPSITHSLSPSTHPSQTPSTTHSLSP